MSVFYIYIYIYINNNIIINIESKQSIVLSWTANVEHHLIVHQYYTLFIKEYNIGGMILNDNGHRTSQSNIVLASIYYKNERFLLFKKILNFLLNCQKKQRLYPCR